jgi:nicotinamide mononucleotide adenylyltransferase
MSKYEAMTQKETDELKVWLITAYKMLNTLGSISFVRQIAKPWKTAVEVNPGALKVIENKASNEFIKKWEQYNIDLPEAVAFLDWFVAKTGITLTVKEKGGLLHSFSVEQCSNLLDLLYNHTAIENPWDHQTGRFKYHELLHAFVNYQMAKVAMLDQLEPSTGAIFKQMLSTKPPEFFQRGVLSDLFVSDNLDEFDGNQKGKILRCNKSRLSTYQINISEVVSNDPEFEYYSLQG